MLEAFRLCIELTRSSRQIDELIKHTASKSSRKGLFGFLFSRGPHSLIAWDASAMLSSDV